MSAAREIRSAERSRTDAYPSHVEPLLELPDLPQNATLLDHLRSQASPPSGPSADYTLGTWQLHTHPDLLGRLLNSLPAGR